MGSTRLHPGSQRAVAGGEGEQSDSHVLRPRLFWTQGGRGTRMDREHSRSRGAELPERGLGNDKKQTETLSLAKLQHSGRGKPGRRP